MLKYIKNGLIDENPTLVQLLGMCATLAVTTSLKNGIGMGLSTTAVLVMSNLMISLLKRIIPQKVRIASYVVVISVFVTIIDMLLSAYLPDLSKSLGIFIPLIVVNCIILARAESFASKNAVLPSVLDGIGMGLGFTFALCLMSIIREVLGNGTIFDIPLGFDETALIMIMPPGGFLALGIILGVMNWIKMRKESKQ